MKVEKVETIAVCFKVEQKKKLYPPSSFFSTGLEAKYFSTGTTDHLCWCYALWRLRFENEKSGFAKDVGENILLTYLECHIFNYVELNLKRFSGHSIFHSFSSLLSHVCLPMWTLLLDQKGWNLLQRSFKYFAITFIALLHTTKRNQWGLNWQCVCVSITYTDHYKIIMKTCFDLLEFPQINWWQSCSKTTIGIPYYLWMTSKLEFWR